MLAVNFGCPKCGNPLIWKTACVDEYRCHKCKHVFTAEHHSAYKNLKKCVDEVCQWSWETFLDSDNVEYYEPEMLQDLKNLQRAADECKLAEMIACPECVGFTGYIDPSCQLCCGNGSIADDQATS